MADFVAAFEIDDSTILFRLHEAALAVAKNGKGSSFTIANSGVVDKDPKKSFKAKDNKYRLFVGANKNVQIFDGAASFLSDNGFMEENKLKKKIGDAAWNKNDSGHRSELTKFKNDAIEVIKTYFKTFAGAEKAKKIDDSAIKLTIGENELPFDRKGEALDKENWVSFCLEFTIGINSGD